MELPYWFLLVISALIAVYLLLGLVILFWKIYRYYMGNSTTKVINPIESLNTEQEEVKVDITPNIVTKEEDEEIPNEQEKVTIEYDPFSTTNTLASEPCQNDEILDNYITINFYLRHNIISSILGLTLLEVKNFPGPNSGGFREVRVNIFPNEQVDINDLPKKLTKYKTVWKMYDKARFNSQFNFMRVQQEDLSTMKMRFKLYGRNKMFIPPKLIFEGILPLKDCKFKSLLSDTLMYVKIPLTSPFVFY